MQIAVGGFCTALPGKSHYKAILQTWAQTSCRVATSDWSSSLKTSSLHSSDTGGSTGNVLIKHSGEPSAEAYAARVLYVSHRNKAGFRWQSFWGGSTHGLNFTTKPIQKDHTTGFSYSGVQIVTLHRESCHWPDSGIGVFCEAVRLCHGRIWKGSRQNFKGKDFLKKYKVLKCVAKMSLLMNMSVLSKDKHKTTCKLRLWNVKDAQLVIVLLV